MNTDQTFAAEKEPEYVGAHSALSDVVCQNWHVDNRMRCSHTATHTVVMADGNGLHEIAMCDACGEPQDVAAEGREWTGVLRDHSPEDGGSA